jgi:polar amino acid transport system substrate-binding protein
MKNRIKTFIKHANIRRRMFQMAGCFGIALTLTVPNIASAASLDEIKTRGTLKVVTEDAFPPYEFITNGKPDGFHKDVIDELRKYAPFKVTQEQLPWTGLLAAVTAGKYDVAITGAGITEKRLSIFNYAPPISLNVTYYLTRKGDDRIKGIKDLSGLKVGVQAGSAVLDSLSQLEAKLKALGGSLGEVVEYQAYPEVYADLANGRLDYAVNSVINAATMVAKRSDTFALGEATSGLGFIAWPVKKGNDDLLNYLAGFVTHMRDTGKLAELQTKWFGKSFPSLPKESIKSVAQFRNLTGR